MSNLSSNLLGFIRQYIKSVDQLETLLLLHANANKSWMPSEISDALRTTTLGAQASLQHLEKHGFVVQSGEGFTFAATTEEISAEIAELVIAYRERRVTVISAIYVPPTDPIKALSDAFRLGREKE